MSIVHCGSDLAVEYNNPLACGTRADNSREYCSTNCDYAPTVVFELLKRFLLLFGRGFVDLFTFLEPVNDFGVSEFGLY